MRTRGDQEASALARPDRRAGRLRDRGRAGGGDGRADAAVHSAKDMPSVMPGPRVRRGAPAGRRPRRAGRRHAGRAARRGAWWRRARPGGGPSWRTCGPTWSSATCGATWPGGCAGREDGGVAAVVVAVAAMERLGCATGSPTCSTRRRAPPGGPGRHRGGVPGRRRRDVRALLAAVDHDASHRALRAERAVLAALGGSCTLPVGAYAERRVGAAAAALGVDGPRGQRATATR